MLLQANLALLFLLPLSLASLPHCPHVGKAQYDYIVVGSGAGGGPVAARLAESGYSVLVVDAGHDVVNVNTTLPIYFGRAVDDHQIDLNYVVNEYPAGFPVQNQNSWYPRARGLGGSTIHNALVNVIGNTRVDFQGIANTFNDETWSRENMQAYFKKLEHNLYLSPNNTDHGFEGWLKTNLNPAPESLDPRLLDSQLIAAVTNLAQSSPPLQDVNSLAGDSAEGLVTPSYTADEFHNRSSVRDRLQVVRNAKHTRLHFALDTLATKILLCESGKSPRAYGVEIAPGAALAVASNFNGKTHLHTKTVTARREVIVSAGAFQSPQLLMLSGIGDSAQLRKHGIVPIVHLPGVGANLQDHDEISVIWKTKQNYSIWEGCRMLSDPAEDPCLQEWIDSGHLNLYSFGAALNMIATKSSPELDEPDIITYFGPAYFPGFVRGFPQKLADTHNAFVGVVLKSHSSTRGTVSLTGSHPQDLLDIQKNHFQAEEGPKDVATMREALKQARNIVTAPPFGDHIETELFPGTQASSDEDIDQHVYQNVFGHHACCTNAMGLSTDPQAVLDGNLKVHGVKGLRVVDASSWPNVPGYFITTPTYMLAEKAADDILKDAKLTDTVDTDDLLVQI